MGLTLNGNTGLIVIALVVVILVGAMTAIVIAGDSVPSVFSDALIALVSATGGGGAIHALQYRDQQATTATVKDAIDTAVHDVAPHP